MPLSDVRDVVSLIFLLKSKISEVVYLGTDGRISASCLLCVPDGSMKSKVQK